VSDFCPDGYVPTQEAIVRAAQYWFPERFAALERAAVPESQTTLTKPASNFDVAARAFSQPQVPDAWRHAFEDIARQTVHRLRNVLYQGKQLKAYYFGGLLDNDRQAVSREFWATPAADGVLEAGTLWPFGRPNAWYERRPSYPLFLIRLELDALLNDEPSARKPLPAGKMLDLVKALHKLDHLNRADQRKAVRDMSEFRRYHITDDIFSEAARQVPRKAGHKLPKRD
jgi:hypothetical protein